MHSSRRLQLEQATLMVVGVVMGVALDGCAAILVGGACSAA